MRGAVHFIGFRDDRVHNAIKVWGFPDFWHRDWDKRAAAEIMPGDIAIFAKWSDDVEPHWRSFNDSQVM